MVPGSSGWGGATTSAASYNTGYGRKSLEGREGRYNALDHSK